ncbi:MAG TPA: transglutaminase domain-containing protein [Polyangia bacterium]
MKILVPALAFLLLGELFVLRERTYSKAWLTTVPAQEALSPTSPHALGGVSWDPGLYRNAPALEPFAAMVREHCPKLPPFGLVTCLSNLLAKRFAHGGPPSQLFDQRFEPALALAGHLAGEPGHCVSRSGILAAALLVSGVPARVVQLQWLPDSGPAHGHNAFEFFDPERGWTLFDPTYGGYFENTAGARSAAAAAFAGLPAFWQKAGAIPAGLENAPTPAESASLAPHAVAFLSYVEPWLYTRIGEKLAPEPFNGRFVIVGPHATAMVLGHWALRGAIVFTGLALLGCGIAAFKLRRRQRNSIRDEEAEAVSEETVAMRAG